MLVSAWLLLNGRRCFHWALLLLLLLGGCFVFAVCQRCRRRIILLLLSLDVAVCRLLRAQQSLCVLRGILSIYAIRITRCQHHFANHPATLAITVSSGVLLL